MTWFWRIYLYGWVLQCPQKVKVCPALHVDSSPNRHTTTSSVIHLLDTTVGISFTMSLPHLQHPLIGIAERKYGFICKEDLSTMVVCPATMHLSPLNLIVVSGWVQRRIFLVVGPALVVWSEM